MTLKVTAAAKAVANAARRPYHRVNPKARLDVARDRMGASHGASHSGVGLKSGDETKSFCKKLDVV